MPSPNRIKRLPKEIRGEVDRLLQAHVPVRDIADHLAQLGHDVSKSGVSRYAQEQAAVAERITRAREISAAFVRELGDEPEGKTGRLVMELMQSLIFDYMVPRDGGDAPSLDAEGMMFMARAIKDLTAAEKASADRELKIRQEVARKVDKAIAGVEKDVGEAAGPADMKAALARIRSEVYGITGAP